MVMERNGGGKDQTIRFMIASAVPPMLNPSALSQPRFRRYPIIIFLLCRALLAAVLGPSCVLATDKTPTDILHVPEIEAGFHLLYQLSGLGGFNGFGGSITSYVSGANDIRRKPYCSSGKAAACCCLAHCTQNSS
jgi:hypothetical protein